MRNKIVAVVMMISMIFLGGCWGQREVDELAWVMALGIDEGSTPGTYLITYQVVLPKKGSNSGESDSWTVSVEAASIKESMNRLYSILYKQPFMGTMKVVVFGDKLARDKGLNEAADFLQRNYIFRPTISLIITPGKAKDILNVKTRVGQASSISLLRIIDNSNKDSAMPNAELDHFLPLMEREQAAMVLPVVDYLKPNEEEIQYEGKDDEPQEFQFRGGAVLDKDRLKDYLTVQETRGFMWLDDQVVEVFLEGEMDNGISVGGDVTEAKTRYSAKEIDGKIGVQYKIKVKSLIQEVQNEGPMNLEQYKDFISKAEVAFEDEIKKECESTISKSKALKVDFLGLGRKIEQKYPEYWKQVKDQWEEKLADVPVSVDIEVINTYGGSTRNGLPNFQ